MALRIVDNHKYSGMIFWLGLHTRLVGLRGFRRCGAYSSGFQGIAGFSCLG